MRILLIDPDAEFLVLVSRYLQEGLGSSVEGAKTGAEGVAKLQERVADCLLLSDMLPDGSGALWLEQIHGRFPGLPIIVLSGQVNEQLAVCCIKVGAQDYLNKDTLTSKELIESVRGALDRETQEQKLREEERLKVLMQLAGATAHELSQPLMSLLGFCGMLRTNPACPPGLWPLVDNIGRAANQVQAVVDRARFNVGRDFGVPVPPSRAVVFSQEFHVLVVEDSDADFSRMSKVLDAEAHQLRLTRAVDLATALQFCGQHAFNLCLVDYQLPDGQGIDFAGMLKQAGFLIPCILVTGMGGESLAAEAFRRGYYDYLPKHEMNQAVLLRSIWNALERARMLREIEEATRRISELSARDKVTGLWNRHRLDERLQEEFSRSRRYSTPLSIGFCDLDHFKGVNDTHGHAVGDQVLRSAGEVMKTALRQTDFIGRYGGEEFCLVFTSTELRDAALCCERIRQRIGKQPFALEGGGSCSITASFGVCQRLSNHEDAAQLLLDVDKALYRAKQGGRNQVYLSEDNGISAWRREEDQIAG